MKNISHFIVNTWRLKRKIDDAIQENLEKKILEILPSQGDFLKDMSINVDSVREHLGYRDIAVEFLAVEM